MNRDGASIALGLLSLASVASVSGCPVAPKDAYPDGLPTDGPFGTYPPSGSGGTGNAVCGDGQVGGAEQCDDDNRAAGDGCDASCKIEGACWECSTAGVACTAVAAGMSCGQDLFCDSQHKCIPCVDGDVASPGCGALSGTACTADTDCASGQCVVGICRRVQGEPCTDDVQCATNLCAGTSGNNVCAPCQTNGDCKSGECGSDTCKAAVGEPCGDPGSCSSDTMCSSPGFCTYDVNHPCTEDRQCISRLCTNGVCQSCGTGTCHNNATCVNGLCGIAFPATSYCIADADCVSQNCDGFPRTCQ